MVYACMRASDVTDVLAIGVALYVQLAIRNLGFIMSMVSNGGRLDK